MNLQRYLQNRSLWEPLLWALFLLAVNACNLFVKFLEFTRSPHHTGFWQVVVWETTSILVIAALLPLVLWFDKRWPLGWQHLPRRVAAHVLASILFSLLHVVLMVLLRKLSYHLFTTASYDFGPPLREFLYEYLKDFRSYALILGIAHLYRFILLRLQGEASLTQEAGHHSEQSVDEPYPKRLLVKKLGKEFLVKVEDIDYIEACGNYVNLHVAERIYPLRSTMTAIEQRLNPDTFRRVHRSFIVNLNAVHEIRGEDSGDAEATLTVGLNIPISRGYRKNLRLA